MGVEGGDLTLATLKELKSGKNIIISSEITPAGKWLKSRFPEAVSLDDIFDCSRNFETLNKKLAKRVLDYAKNGDVIFLVDGDVKDSAACRIILSKRKNVNVLTGISKADYYLGKLGAGGSYLALSAYDVAEKTRLSLPLVVYDIDGELIAGEVKLALSDKFGDEIPCYFFHGSEYKKIPLYELDRIENYDCACSVVITELGLTEKARYDFDDLIKILKILRSENGCPWDKAQTKESIRINAIEEIYELIDAIDNGDDCAICEEAGDVILQAAFQAVFAEERGAFTYRDVLSELCGKLIARHTHVFGQDKAATADNALEVWNKNKAAEKGYENGSEYLSAVPKGMPALLRADKVSKRSGKYNMDFPDAESALKKLYEEIDEVKAELKRGDEKKISEKCGDLLFSAASFVRKCGANSELSLKEATDKFIRRFTETEKLITADGKDMKSLTAEEIDGYYNEAKKY